MTDDTPHQSFFVLISKIFQTQKIKSKPWNLPNPLAFLKKSEAKNFTGKINVFHCKINIF